MNPIGALAGAYSLFQGIGQQRAQRRQMQEAERRGRQADTLAAQQYAGNVNAINDLAAQDSPSAALAQIEADFQHGMKLATGNVAAARRTAGARVGDSSTSDALRSVSEGFQLQRSAQLQRVAQIGRQNALQRYQLLNGASTQYQNALNRSGTQEYNRALASGGDLSGALAAIGSAFARPQTQAQPTYDSGTFNAELYDYLTGRTRR